MDGISVLSEFRMHVGVQCGMHAVACDLIRKHLSPLTFLSFLFSSNTFSFFFFLAFALGKRGRISSAFMTCLRTRTSSHFRMPYTQETDTHSVLEASRRCI